MAGTREEHETLLRQFEVWLAETESELASLADDVELDRDPGVPVEGTLPLVEAFSALRHELKLQTKSARGLEEQVQATLGGLEEATRRFDSMQSREAQAAERASLPLVELLIGLDESLERCGRALDAARDRALANGPGKLIAALETRFNQQSAWRKWWSRSWHEATLEVCREQASAAYRELLGGLEEGFQLVRNRLTRSLAERQIQRIPCVGKRVDPDLMTVVELSDDTDVPPETVAAELRPGYVWRDRVLRFAEVRARRATPAASEDFAHHFGTDEPH